jgi:uncharacterized Zn finger protein (UPF0148 family)
MGSTVSEVRCDLCGNDNCIEELYYKTGELNIFCPDCGYYYSSRLERNENGKLFKDENGDIKLNIDECKNPYGSFRIETESGYNQGGSLIDEVSYIELKNNIEEYEKNLKKTRNDDLDHNDIDPWGEEDWENQNNDKEKITKVTISRFVNGKIIKEILYTCV